MSDMKVEKSKTILILGASRGLGRAFLDGIGAPGDQIIGVSRSAPKPTPIREQIDIRWIEADFSDPRGSVKNLVRELGETTIDVTIYNVGIWEPDAFSGKYRFTDDSDETVMSLISANLTTPILLLKSIMPLILKSETPRVILTGSTSALRQSGRPEVTFGATKHGLNGIAEALREGYREQRLGITTLQLGYLNTEDPVSVSRDEAAKRGDGFMVPVHDVVAVVQTILNLSPSSYVREITLPAILDERF